MEIPTLEEMEEKIMEAIRRHDEAEAATHPAARAQWKGILGRLRTESASPESTRPYI